MQFFAKALAAPRRCRAAALLLLTAALAVAATLHCMSMSCHIQLPCMIWAFMST